MKNQDQFISEALRHGLLTQEQINQTISTVETVKATGLKTSFQEVLIEKGYCSRAQIQKILKSIGAPVTALGIYDIYSKLGSGGMGTVYLAKNRETDQSVALKVLSKHLMSNQDSRERFLREAQNSARLNHPYIVRLLDSGEVSGNLFIAMELVEGHTLKSLIEKKSVFTETDAIEIMIQIAEALRHAHALNVVHRDIKPENIMVTPENTVKLLDMGLAKNTSSDASLTQTGFSLGTPYYMSPEQIQGIKDIDGRSDLYSLGATLYHMVTGSPPYGGTSAQMIVSKHLTDSLPSPQDKNSALTDGICHIIEKLMAKDREDRYSDGATLLTDLKRVKRGESPSSGRVDIQKTMVQRAIRSHTKRRISSARSRTVRQRKKSYIPLLVGAAIIFIGIIGFMKFMPQETHENRSPSKDITKKLTRTNASTEQNPLELEARRMHHNALTKFKNEEWTAARSLFSELIKEKYLHTAIVAEEGMDIAQKLAHCDQQIENIEAIVKSHLEDIKDAMDTEDYLKASQLITQINETYSAHPLIKEHKTLAELPNKITRELKAKDLQDKLQEAIIQTSKEVISLRNTLIDEYADTSTIQSALEEHNLYEREIVAYQLLHEANTEAQNNNYTKAAALLSRLLLTYEDSLIVTHNKTKIQEIHRRAVAKVSEQTKINATELLAKAKKAEQQKDLPTALQYYRQLKKNYPESQAYRDQERIVIQRINELQERIETDLVKQLYQEAKEKRKEKKYKEAKDIYTQLITDYGEHSYIIANRKAIEGALQYVSKKVIESTPLGQLIYFNTTDKYVYSMKTDGSDKKKYFQSPIKDILGHLPLALSPSGKYIAYTATSNKMYIVDTHGNKKRLTSSTFRTGNKAGDKYLRTKGGLKTEKNPAWDGDDYVAFSGLSIRPLTGVYISRVGSNKTTYLRNLTSWPALSQKKTAVIAYIHQVKKLSTIAVHKNTEKNLKKKYVSILRPRAHTLTELTWSPDESLFAYTVVTNTGKTHYVYTASAKRAEKTSEAFPKEIAISTPHRYNQWHPHFSPDSTYLAFSQDSPTGVVTAIADIKKRIIITTIPQGDHHRLIAWIK